MKTIAVAGLQDEAAKSQFAAQFAEQCAQRGLGTLFLDLDTQGQASRMLSQSASAAASPVPASLFFNELAFVAQMVPDASAGRVVLASADQGLEMCSESGLSAMQALTDSLEAVEQKFNLCVLCTSSTKSALAAAAQKTATWTMVPVFSSGKLSSLVLKSHYRVITVSSSAQSTMDAMCAAALSALGLSGLVSPAAMMGVKVEEMGSVASEQQQAYLSRVYERLSAVQGMTAMAREEVKKELESLLSMPALIQQSAALAA